MAILLEVANTAVVRIVVGYLFVENLAMNEIYRADVANAGAAVVGVTDNRVGAAGRNATTNVMLTCRQRSWPNRPRRK